MSARSTLEVIDWRRRTFALYAEVRAFTDAAEAHAQWRDVRDDMFAHHPATAILPEDRAAFTGLPVSPYDPAWRFEVEIQDAVPASFEYETGTDGLVSFDRVGTVDIPDVGVLDVWRHEGYGGGIFLPIKDALAGKPGGTYGGGRYLLDTIKGADLGNSPESNTLVLDFNFAYNPSCAYDPDWACPLAPAGDRVKVEIPVGERYDGVY